MYCMKSKHRCWKIQQAFILLNFIIITYSTKNTNGTGFAYLNENYIDEC